MLLHGGTNVVEMTQEEVQRTTEHFTSKSGGE